MVFKLSAQRGHIVPMRDFVAVAPIGKAELPQVFQPDQLIKIAILLGLAHARGLADFKTVKLVFLPLAFDVSFQLLKELPLLTEQ